MTLTIPDVEKWEPDQLTTAGNHADGMATKLDAAVKDGSDKTRALTWSGAAATAANARMDIEQTRAGTVSTALQGLHTAFTSQVDNLKNAKTKVLQLRDLATTPSATTDGVEPIPGFKVEPNGTVTADDRIAKVCALMNGQQRVDESLRILRDAATWQVDITNALQQAESVAEQAKTQVAQAVGNLQAAYDALGEPKSGTAPAPTPTTPAATNTATPVASNKPNYATGGNHNSSGNSHSSSGTPSTGSPSSGYPTSSGSPTGPMPSGDVAEWIKKAKEKLIAMGYSPDQIDERALAMMIEHESGGNPQIVNNWDSNAAAGHPSKGLMQTIDSTFNAYKAPGHDDIYDPVDNIIAGTRYAIDRYGSLSNVPGVAAVNSGGAYQGY
ncbi:transglycosylase SLT domain-containing protein [Nocardia sp. NBC_01009]|uniref:transglycosylase SLT domain-containing protein n=1 Tax=Nocardia sp. NBC_01009 TaxID=2975996 RepID=UPI00386AF373|nr:transglycosylase SLT domain-containing protein [Nocardia sp. NBC_01009]